MKMRKQRLMGLAMLAITALILVMARGGKTPEDSDATAALLTGPLGLYMLLSKTYILYEDKDPKEATEESRSGEATPGSRPGRTRTTPSVRLQKRSSPSRTLRAR